MRSQFLYEITDKVLQHNIPDKLVINIDQTASKLVATGNITMAAKGEKHISCAGATDKRAMTVTLCESLDGCMLPSQLIYFTFLHGFCLAFKEKHWSNETDTVCLIEELLVPYIEKGKKRTYLKRAF